MGVHQVNEQPFVGHHAIQMELQRSIAWDMGQTLRKISKVDIGKDNGQTYQEEECENKEGGDQEEKWYQWTTQAEAWLLGKYDKEQEQYKGRGLKRGYFLRSIGSPQTTEGTATTRECRKWALAKTRVHRAISGIKLKKYEVVRIEILERVEQGLQELIL